MNDGDGEKRPGFLRMAGSLLRAPFEERMAREDHARFERLSLQAASQTLEEVVRRVTPEDDGFTDNMLGKPDARELEPDTAESLRKKAIEASLKSAHMVGYLRSMARFVIGKGPEFSPVDMPDETTEAMSDWWGKFKVINKWDEQLEDEIPLRTWRDGETFIRRFEQIDEGPPEEWEPAAKQLTYLRGLGLGVDETELQPEDIPEGMVILRLIPADQITDPQNKISHGILTAAKDVCTVLAYLWAPDGTKVEEVIAAKEVMHVKIRVDQDVKRGRSLLEPILKRNKQYEDWLEYRVILNLVRAAVVLVKKVEGTAAQLSSVRSNHAPEREEAANTRRQKGDTAEELQAAYPNIPPKSVTFIPAKLEDNPTLQEKDPGYLANLMALSRVERLRLHGGNWKVRAKAGEVFDEDWFTARRGRASDAARVRYWDKAGTEDGGKFTAGVLMARTTEGLFWIEDVVRGQWSALKREQIILETAESDGPSVHVWVEQEPGSGGKESAEATVRMLAGYIAHADRVTGDKVTRAQPLSAQAEAGNVVLTAAPWNRPFLRELHSFPDGKFKDQADAASGAFNKLSGVYIPVEEEYDFAEEGGFVL